MFRTRVVTLRKCWDIISTQKIKMLAYNSTVLNILWHVYIWYHERLWPATSISFWLRTDIAFQGAPSSLFHDSSSFSKDLWQKSISVGCYSFSCSSTIITLIHHSHRVTKTMKRWILRLYNRVYLWLNKLYCYKSV